MTPQQGSRLADIAADLKRCKTHPSPTVREKVQDFTQEEVNGCIEALRQVYAEADGWNAHRIIKASYEDGEAGVLKLHRSKKNETGR